MTTKTTGQKINELAPGKFLQLGKVVPAGSLEVRKLASGVVFTGASRSKARPCAR